MIYAGRILEDGKTLVSFGFKSGNTVHLVVKKPADTAGEPAAPPAATATPSATPSVGMGGLGTMFGGANPVRTFSLSTRFTLVKASLRSDADTVRARATVLRYFEVYVPPLCPPLALLHGRQMLHSLPRGGSSCLETSRGEKKTTKTHKL